MAGQGGARVGAGKKKTSDHLKVVKGTFRKDRVNKSAPAPSSKPPVAPSHLNDRAVYHFGRIVELMGERASETFVDIIATLAIRLEEVELFYLEVHERPTFTVVDMAGNKIIKSNPVCSLYKEAMRHAHTLLGEVGLTPASIGRMGEGKQMSKEVDPWDEL